MAHSTPTEENKALVRRFYSEAERHGTNMDWMDAWLADDFVAHPPGSGAADRQAFKAMASSYYTSFHDMRHDLHELVAEGDFVAIRMTLTMRHAGEFAGIPATGRTVKVGVGEIALARIVNSKIAEYWFEFDSAGLLQLLR